MDTSRVPSFVNRLSLYSRELPYSQLRTREEAKTQQTIIYNRLRENDHDIPPYELQNYIGKGSYGRVYVARDTRSDGYGRVAIKILEVDAVDFQAHLLDRDQTAQDFLKELKTLQQIQSHNAPNVNKIFEVLEVYSQFWIISEYCPGGSVHTLMQATDNKVEEQYLRPIARELAIGLHAVHKAGVIHRDIKAANVMIHEEGRLQIIDFGVAGTLLNQEDKRTTVIGTPHWMGPEVFKGKDGKDKGYGTKADTWAYGCTLWEMATGRPPRSDIDMKNLEFALRTRAAPRLGFQEGYSQALSDLITFTLVKDPEQRPSMEQILDHPYLRGTEISHPTSSLSGFVREFQDWAHQGGQRQSLFNPHGAAAARVAEEIERQPEWRFSTLATTEMMDRLSSDLDDERSTGFIGDIHLSSHLDQAADMSSTRAQEDAFNSYDASEPSSPYLSTSETTPSGSPTLQNTPMLNASFQPSSSSSEVAKIRVIRGEKQLGRLFDPRHSEYMYPSLTSNQSDLPLRSTNNDSNTSDGKGKVLDASEIATSNSGNIALADPATLKAKRLKDKDRPPTMAWDFATAIGEPLAIRDDGSNDPEPLNPRSQTSDKYQQSPAAWTPGEINDFGSPGDDLYDGSHPTGSADYGYLGEGAYGDSYHGPSTSSYSSSANNYNNESFASEPSSLTKRPAEASRIARQTLDLDALMDNLGTPSDDVDEVPYYAPPSSTNGTLSTSHSTQDMANTGPIANLSRQTLDLDALMSDMNSTMGSSTTYVGSQLGDTTLQDPAPYSNGIDIPPQAPFQAQQSIFGNWRPAFPFAQAMTDGADDELVYDELMRMLTDHSRVLGAVSEYYAHDVAQMDEQARREEDLSDVAINA